MPDRIGNSLFQKLKTLTMIKTFQLIKDTRQNVLKLLSEGNTERLFNIPEPFNNHIFWNAAHLMATHQLLLYTFSNSKERLNQEFIKKYTKGTTPDQKFYEEDLEFVITHLIPSFEESITDFQDGYFGEYKPLQTSFGSTINSVEEAFQYIVLHEAMHFGQMKMIEKLLI